MTRGFRTTLLALSASGVALLTTAHRTRQQPCYADTAFQNRQTFNVRDFPGAPGYHLINNFWVPHFPAQAAIPFPTAHFLHAGPQNEDNHESDDADDLFDVTSTTAIGIGSTLFHHGYARRIALQEAIRRSRKILELHREEIGGPGFVVGVSIDGRVVWTEGLGWADFENQVPCHAGTVMRIASIGKAISMTVVAKLWEQGLLDLDKPVQEYVPEFPFKTFDGKPVTITCRQLVSHLSGIRHYSRTKKSDDEDTLYTLPGTVKNSSASNEIAKPAVSAPKYNEFDEKEYYLQKPFKSTVESVGLFKDDPLLANPGDEFLYTTHGWTLLCAVIESVTKRKLTDVLKDLFRDLALTNTFLDEHEPIVHNRSRNYRRDKLGRLKNAPYVDNSYKWAGGGLLSTVGDLMQFAHLLLNAYQSADDAQPGGYLKSSTIKTMWSLVDKTRKNEFVENGMGMGWMVVPPRFVGSWCFRQPHVVYHTGGAIGASSVLAIIPRQRVEPDPSNPSRAPPPPQGIVVTLIANLEQAALYKKSLEIARIFDQVEDGKN